MPYAQWENLKFLQAQIRKSEVKQRKYYFEYQAARAQSYKADENVYFRFSINRFLLWSYIQTYCMRYFYNLFNFFCLHYRALIYQCVVGYRHPKLVRFL